MKFLFNLIRGIRGLLLPFLVFGSVPNVLAQEMFSIPAPTNLVKNLAVDGIQALSTNSTVSTQDTQTTDLNLPGNIYGLAITASFGLRIAFGGNFQPDDPSAFVRVVLIDNDTQQEYLVYQKNYQDLTTEEYNTPTALTINAVCQETCIFPQAVSRDMSATLRVQARHGQIIVSNISYLDAPISGVDATELRRQQNAVVIQKFNEQDLGWIAGETSVSNLTYAEKKRLVNLTAESSGELNLQGFEFYRGGVFELKSKDTTGSVHRSTRQSTLVDNFAWTKQHGKSWVTEVRDQGNCGSCYSHSSIGAVEAVAKLYFNDSLWNIDLAEQDVLSCGRKEVSMNETCGQGGSPYSVLEYVGKNGIVDEACFPYAETKSGDAPYQSCGNKCATPNQTIKTNGVTSPSQTLTEDLVRTMIIENGPLSGIIDSLSHAMLLIGFETDPKDGRTIWIFKNSWGNGWGADSRSERTDYNFKSDKWGKYWKEGYAQNGYAYIKFDMDNLFVDVVQTPLVSSPVREIKCVDQDLDTYCNWGISKDKPPTCPASCKPEKDCDDLEPKKGPFDAKYNCPNTNNEPVPQSPVATFTLSPTAGTAPLTVTLDASASKDPDGTMVSYDWSIGEEEKPIGTGNSFTYTIDTAGQTVITLVVKDNQGLAAKDKKVVTVTPAQQLTLQVNKNGTGEIISLDGQINCGTTCTHNYSDVIPVTLRAQISDDLEVKWEGCLTNSTDPKTCEVTMDANKTVTATFSQKSSPQPTVFPLTVNVTGAGKVMCNNVDCLATQNYPANTTVTLTATPASDSTFAGWTGACSGTLVCQVVMTAAKTVTATFQVLPPTVFPLTVNVTGAGKVMCNNVDCLATQNYPANTTVTLTATPASGAIFAGWTGACSGTLVCQVVMTAAKTVSATFQVLPPLPPVPVVSTCPTDKTVISETCKGYGKQLACNVTIEPRANVSNVVFACNATNQGWIANSTIKTGATVKGGVWTGYITNEGTLADFEFRGASITGGTLSGKIVNKSKVSNWFKNVRLAANTIITGGAVTGTITGDCKAPAKLEKLKVKAGSHLSCVIIGNGVTVQKNVTIENSEQPK